MSTPESTQAIAQEQLPPTTISLKELCNERERYIVFPSFQRQQVWTVRQEQALIDTILLGDPISPIEGYQYFTENGEVMYGIVDGHQRISTILDYRDGKFKTWTVGQKQAAEPNSDPPVQPGKRFEGLDVIAKSYFLDYRLQINKVRKRSDKQIATRFLRIQNHMPLSAAEKLNAYASKAKDSARRIEQHSFWEDFYGGKSNREQKLQTSLYLLAIEMTTKKTLDLSAWQFIHGLAAGNYDHEITDAIVDAVLARLDVVSHVYMGCHFTVRAALVAMYQSVKFIEQSGYTVQAKDNGKLTSWINGVVMESNRASSVPKYNTPIQQILHEANQKRFWERHLPTVFALFDISNASEFLEDCGLWNLKEIVNE